MQLKAANRIVLCNISFNHTSDEVITESTSVQT